MLVRKAVVAAAEGAKYRGTGGVLRVGHERRRVISREVDRSAPSGGLYCGSVLSRNAFATAAAAATATDIKGALGRPGSPSYGGAYGFVGIGLGVKRRAPFTTLLWNTDGDDGGDDDEDLEEGFAEEVACQLDIYPASESSGAGAVLREKRKTLPRERTTTMNQNGGATLSSSSPFSVLLPATPISATIPVPARPAPSLAGAVVVSHSDHLTVLRPVSDADVLFGRGRASDVHPGNVRFRLLLLDSGLENDDDTDNEKKRKISGEVLRVVRDEWKGAFLKRLDDGRGSPEGAGGGTRWVEATDRQSRKKVVKTANNMRRQQGTEGKVRTEMTTKMMTMDQYSSSSLLPRDSDVLLGRGTKLHAGNMRFRDLVARRFDEFHQSPTLESAKRTPLRSVAVDIVESVTGPVWGGRFLIKLVNSESEGAREVWVEVDKGGAVKRTLRALLYQKNRG